MVRVVFAGLFLVFSAAAAACGSSPSAPTPASTFVAKPSGSWAGTTSLGLCSSSETPGVVEVCVSAGAIPITARFEQTGDTVLGEVTYQGVPAPVSGRVTGRLVRLDGVGAPLADPLAPRFEIRDWRTEFGGPDDMSGTFTLKVTVSRDGVPTTASTPIQVSRLVRTRSS